jgi:hypothetical protein
VNRRVIGILANLATPPILNVDEAFVDVAGDFALDRSYGLKPFLG